MTARFVTLTIPAELGGYGRGVNGWCEATPEQPVAVDASRIVTVRPSTRHGSVLVIAGGPDLEVVESFEIVLGRIATATKENHVHADR